VKEPWVPIR